MTHKEAAMDATTRRLVDFALAYRFEDLPASTVPAAKARLLDSVAVGLAAYAAPPVRILRKTAPHVRGHWKATMWGTRDQTTPDIAALVNGSMVRYFDLNDAYRTLDASHPSDNLPGLMAVVEALVLITLVLPQVLVVLVAAVRVAKQLVFLGLLEQPIQAAVVVALAMVLIHLLLAVQAL